MSFGNFIFDTSIPENRIPITILSGRENSLAFNLPIKPFKCYIVPGDEFIFKKYIKQTERYKKSE
jgi:hypothetical protein